MVRRGETDYVELARQHGLSRARVSQICSLTLVAPEIQEAILGLTRAHNPGTTGYLRLIAVHSDWEHQRRNLADAAAACLEVRG